MTDLLPGVVEDDSVEEVDEESILVWKACEIIAEETLQVGILD
jgi:hypothetical protein